MCDSPVIVKSSGPNTVIWNITCTDTVYEANYTVRMNWETTAVGFVYGCIVLACCAYMCYCCCKKDRQITYVRQIDVITVMPPPPALPIQTQAPQAWGLTKASEDSSAAV